MSAVHVIGYHSDSALTLVPSPAPSSFQDQSFPLCTNQPGVEIIILTYAPMYLLIGPVLVFTVPKVRREYFGFKGVEALPITYPRK
jgi:hypothetical protein